MTAAAFTLVDESSRWVFTLTCNYSWDDNAFTREGDRERKINHLGITIAECPANYLCRREKEIITRSIRPPQLHSKTTADAQRREQASLGSSGGNPKLKKTQLFLLCVALTEEQTLTPFGRDFWEDADFGSQILTERWKFVKIKWKLKASTESTLRQLWRWSGGELCLKLLAIKDGEWNLV